MGWPVPGLDVARPALGQRAAGWPSGSASRRRLPAPHGLPERDHAATLGIVVLLQTPAEDETTAGRWALVSPADTDIVTSIRPPDGPGAIPVSRGPRDQGLTALPPAGQPGHGGTATLRRRPARIVQGVERGYTDAFELICRECGDHPYLDYSEIPPRLQRIRGPYTMRAGLAAYEKHLGLTT
jgi:hypothetical protein